MKPELSKAKSVMERESDLWIASEQYMQGDLSLEKLEEVELSNAFNLKEATLANAKKKYINLGIRLFVLIIISSSYILSIGTSLAIILLTKNALFLIIALLPIFFTRPVLAYFFPEKKKQIQSRTNRGDVQRELPISGNDPFSTGEVLRQMLPFEVKRLNIAESASVDVAEGGALRSQARIRVHPLRRPNILPLFVLPLTITLLFGVVILTGYLFYTGSQHGHVGPVTQIATPTIVLEPNLHMASLYSGSTLDLLTKSNT
jgi:hypothetical protein